MESLPLLQLCQWMLQVKDLCFVLSLSSCFQRYAKAEMDRVSVAFIVGCHGAEMKFQQQIPHLLSCSAREKGVRRSPPTYEQAL